MSRVLEWGQGTDEPGSRVLDAGGRMVFTGAAVEAVTLEEHVRRGRGRVTVLGDSRDGTTVRVSWTRGGETVVPSRKVHLVR